jgi:hypothetical protein
MIVCTQIFVHYRDNYMQTLQNEYVLFYAKGLTMKISNNQEYKDIFQYLLNEEQKLYFVMHHEDRDKMIEALLSAVVENLNKLEPAAWSRILTNFTDIRNSLEFKNFEKEFRSIMSNLKSFVEDDLIKHMINSYIKNDGEFQNPINEILKKLSSFLYENRSQIIHLLILWVQVNKGNIPRLLSIKDDLVKVLQALSKSEILSTAKNLSKK